MYKLILWIALLTGCNYAAAQNFNYGVVLGTHLYDVEIDGSMSGSGGTRLHIGGLVITNSTKVLEFEVMYFIASLKNSPTPSRGRALMKPYLKKQNPPISSCTRYWSTMWTSHMIRGFTYWADSNSRTFWMQNLTDRKMTTSTTRQPLAPCWALVQSLAPTLRLKLSRQSI